MKNKYNPHTDADWVSLNWVARRLGISTNSAKKVVACPGIRTKTIPGINIKYFKYDIEAIHARMYEKLEGQAVQA